MAQRKMPAQNRHVSEQAVGTPPEFIQAACRKLRIVGFSFDLAADARNTIVGTSGHGQKRHFDIADDALKQDWTHPFGPGPLYMYSTPWNWLNPPFARIDPWAEKCCLEAERGAYTAMLVPSSTGTNWWNDYVHGYAYVLSLRGRIRFIGHTDQYPKDLALVLYTPQGFNGSDIWDWKAELTKGSHAGANAEC